MLENIGRIERCLVHTGATGLQDECLDLHEIAESVGAPEAHRALDVPDKFSQVLTGYSDPQGAQGRSVTAMG